jgi:hypothetical protein
MRPVLLGRHTDPKSLRPNGSLLRDQEIAARNELRHHLALPVPGAKWTHVSAEDAPMRGELDLTRLGRSKRGAAATLTASLVSPCWSRTSNCHKKDASCCSSNPRENDSQRAECHIHFPLPPLARPGPRSWWSLSCRVGASGIDRSCVIATPKNRRLTSPDMSWRHCIAAWQTVSCRNSRLPAPR